MQRARCLLRAAATRAQHRSQSTAVAAAAAVGATPAAPSTSLAQDTKPPARDEKSTGRARRRRAPAALQLTDAAAARIRRLLSARDPRPVGVRISLKTRGCNGMAYTLNYAEKRSPFDESVDVEGAQVFIDPRALMHIVGTRMDFVDNDLVSEFVFHNPNAKGTCGCGESFNV